MGHNIMAGHVWVPPTPGAETGPCGRCRYGPDALHHTGGVRVTNGNREAIAARQKALATAETLRADLAAARQRATTARLAIEQIRVQVRHLTLHNVHNLDIARALDVTTQAVDVIASVLAGEHVLPLPELALPPASIAA